MLNQWEIDDSCKAHSKINKNEYIRCLWLKWRGSAQGWPFWGLGRWVTSFGENVPQKPHKGAWIGKLA